MLSLKLTQEGARKFLSTGYTQPNVLRLAARLVPVVLGAALCANSLNDEDRKLLQDVGGWEYISMSDRQNGFPTQHTCFDGKPHPNECSGNLTLRADGTFTQTTRIKGQSVQRKGHYKLTDGGIAFFDEFETKDGPYALTLDRNGKTLRIAMRQVTVDLMLASEYRTRLKEGRL